MNAMDATAAGILVVKSQVHGVRVRQILWEVFYEVAFRTYALTIGSRRPLFVLLVVLVNDY
jgi:hypothetical protein